MRVYISSVYIIDPANQFKTRTTMPKRVRAPNCTHVDMDRIYGRDFIQCYVCGRSPSIGFLYECRQDCDSAKLQDYFTQDANYPTGVVKSDLRKDLESIGLSESVILTAENGQYTQAQLIKLKELKLELQQVISDAHQANQTNDAMTKLTALAKVASSQLPSNNDGAFNSLPITEQVGARKSLVRRSMHLSIKKKSLTRYQNPPECAFRACHTCRPYYRDRVYISFEVVFAANLANLKVEDTQELPVKSSQVMRSIGTTVHSSHPHLSFAAPRALQPTSTNLDTYADAPHTASTVSTNSSGVTFKTTQSDMDEITAQRRPRRRFYSMGRRSSGDIARDLSRLPSLFTAQGLKNAVLGIFRPGRESSSSGSNITLPLPRTGTMRDLNESKPVREFDVGALRRVRKQKERSELRSGAFTGGYEGVEAEASISHQRPEYTSSHLNDGVEESSGTDSTFSMYSCASEGSEVEVEGGVALTEEAVETHTPDILALDVQQTKPKPGFNEKEVEEDEAGADIGLRSIMMQV